MSEVTNVILTFNICEEGREVGNENIYFLMDAINAWLSNQGYGPFGGDVDKVSGGKKHLESPLFVAAFNYFNLDEFIKFLKTLSWEELEYVQVFIREQEDDKFTLINVFAE